MKNFVKQNLGKFTLVIILLGLYFYHADSFFLVLLIYGLGLYTIVVIAMTKKLWLFLTTTIWATLVVTTGMIIYVNYALPHGQSYDTEMNTCEFSDGPCKEIYKEDLNKLAIPNWAKFLRSNTEALFGGLLFAAIVASSKDRDSLKP